uniref:Uncharacterized protein n=1 Tax=Anopheles melas TaxID=34690 RepID=A0A182U5I9_9DIPT
MGSFGGSATGLSRTLSTPPVAESTHIGGTSFSAAWNGASLGGQSKRRPTSPLMSNSRTLFKSSGNLTGIGRVNSRVITDARSPGLVNRLVRYYDRGQSQAAINRSQSLSSVYNKPGQFPLVQLRKQELRYTNSSAARRNGNFSMLRIAPPERSLFQTNKRSSIFRSGSMFLPTTNESANESSLFAGLGTSRNGPSGSGSGSGSSGSGGGGDVGDAENRVITPCAELDSTPTRSVLDALKEISRKRINSEELDADRIKKQCQELSELDAAGSGPPSSTAAVAIGTHGLATKRSREQASESSPVSPSELGPPGLGGVGRAPHSGGEQQTQKKRLCVKNNDILSSLSSSLVAMNTPKRNVVPRNDRRLYMNHSISMSSPAISTIPTSSSTLVGLATPEKFSNMALNSPGPLERSDSPIDTAANGHAQQSVARTSTTLDHHWNQSNRGSASKEPMEQLLPPHRAPPKITLFNRPYESAAMTGVADKPGSPSARGTQSKHASRLLSSDGEDDEHGEGSGKVQFVKPKEKSPNDVTLSGLGSGGFSSSRDPLKKPAPSKLTVMLKCLSGDLDDYEEEQEEQQLRQPSRATATVPQSRNGFSFGSNAAAKDTVDGLKELPTSGPSKQPAVTTLKDSAASTPVSAASSSTPVTNGGLSALINNPIKDTGLGKIAVPTSKETVVAVSAVQTSAANEAKTASAPSEAAKTLTFSFGSNSSTTSVSSPPPVATTTTTSTGFSLPSKPPATTTTAAGLSSTATPAFSFGTPASPKTTGTAQTTSSPIATSLGTSNLIAFSPAPGTLGSTFGSGSGAAKLPSPVLQFGSPATTSTVTTTATPGSTSTFSFAAGASTMPTAANTPAMPAASISSPTTFGSPGSFGGFKLPPAATQAGSTGATTSTVTTTPSVTPAFSFGANAATASSSTTTTTIPVFGSSSSLFTNAASSATSTTGTNGATMTSGSTFTFGAPKSTPSAPAPSFTFGATAQAPTAQASSTPAAASTNAFSSSAAPSTTTFPTFGSIAGAGGGAAATTGAAAATTSANPTNPSQPTFTFGGAKPASATTPNLFGAAAPSSNSTTSASSDASKTNLFASARTQQANASNIFGAAAAGSQAAPAAPSTGGTSVFGVANGAVPGAASSPFTFGAAKPAAAAAPTSGNANSNNNNSSGTTGSIFGNAVASITSPAGPAATPGMFTFGSAKAPAPGAQGVQNAATSNQQQPQASNPLGGGGVPTFGATATSNTNASPFAFGANKAPAGGGIFGGITATNNNNSTTGNSKTSTPSAVPAFGATMNGANPAPAFGTTGSIFGSANATGASTGPGSANQSVGSIFGTPQSNGPQSVNNTAASTGQPGGLFTFGASNAANSAPNNATPAFGSNAGSGSTFGGFNATPAAGTMSNGIGGNTTAPANKPFTFGASSAVPMVPQNNAQQQQPQQQQQQQAAPSQAGAFNFNLGSNAAPKPFNFTGGLGNANANVASPPMFGSPVATGNANPAPNNASPFAFGAMVNGANAAPAPNSNATAGPFTFGASAAQPAPGPASPFNFSAGNVAAVAPQPQQQPGTAFTFGGAQQQQPQQQQQQQQQQPFGMGGGAAPFGAPPAFGAPGGIVPGGGMPTFSIGTNSTPNGPPRRIKVATRRVK